MPMITLHQSTRAVLGAVCLLVTSQNAMSADLLSEDYDGYTPGLGSYTGAWSFIPNDSTFGTGVSALHIGSGGISMNGSGSYLYYSQTASWSGQVIRANVFTTDPFESPVGHFFRTEHLAAGQVYEVSLWRFIERESRNSTSNSPPDMFSVWDGSTVDPLTPFLSSPDSLITNMPYDALAGGWQQVNLTFTAPGTVGSGDVPVSFMMGAYQQTHIPFGRESLNEWDNNFRTIDPMPDGPPQGYELGTVETFRLGIDGFTVTAVPEPGSCILAAIGMAMLGLSRRRPKSVKVAV